MISTTFTPTVTIETKLPNGDIDVGRETELDNRKSVSPGFLLYEVERDILSLTLEDIGYILDFGPEVFAYSLIDKLGYLQKLPAAGGEDDPHVSVIEANKEQLMEKLRNLRATKMKHDVHVATEESATLQVLEPIESQPLILSHLDGQVKRYRKIY